MGRTALMIAASGSTQNFGSMMETLLKHNADPKAADTVSRFINSN
jgi:hypothetical protein